MIHYKISFRNISLQKKKNHWLWRNIWNQLIQTLLNKKNKRLLGKFYLFLNQPTHSLRHGEKYNGTERDACGNKVTARLETGRELNYKIKTYSRPAMYRAALSRETKQNFHLKFTGKKRCLCSLSTLKIRIAIRTQEVEKIIYNTWGALGKLMASDEGSLLYREKC